MFPSISLAPSALLLLIVLSCSSQSTRPPAPAIDTVSAEMVPRVGGSVYQHLLRIQLPDEIGRHADSMVTLLRASGVFRAALFYPLTPTPCMAPNTSNNLILRLPATNQVMLALGFDTTSGAWLMNCGVPRFVRHRIAP